MKLRWRNANSSNGGSAWHAIAVAPIFVWELSLGLWMTFKGFRKDAPAHGRGRRRDGEPGHVRNGDLLAHRRDEPGRGLSADIREPAVS